MFLLSINQYNQPNNQIDNQPKKQIDTSKYDVCTLIIKKVRKNLKKYYYLLDIQFHSNLSPDADLLQYCVKTYNNQQYIIKKPRFNQNGRPSKTINTPPLILINDSALNAGLIKSLRSQNIPVEAISINTDDTKSENWQHQTAGPKLGYNFVIPEKILINCLIKVAKQQRLIINHQPLFCQNLIEIILNEKLENPDNEIYKKEIILKPLILALGMPVWYYENLLAIRPKTS